MNRVRVIVDVQLATSLAVDPAGDLPDSAVFAADISRVTERLSTRGFQKDLVFGNQAWPRPRLDGEGFLAAERYEAFPVDTGVLIRGTIPIENVGWASELAIDGVAGITTDLPVELMGPDAAADIADRNTMTTFHGLDPWIGCLDGGPVHVAIVDSGINLNRLRGAGVAPEAILKTAQSWSINPYRQPGMHEVGHGTSMAALALAGCPSAELLDIAAIDALAKPNLSHFLSDMIVGYLRLWQSCAGSLYSRQSLNGLVLSNSWRAVGMDGDFPAGHPWNYGANPRHPFNALVTLYDWLGADIVFAAGNFQGRRSTWSPSSAGTPEIHGANSLPTVLTVSAYSMLTKAPAQFVCCGPGAIGNKNPDLSAATDIFVSSPRVRDTQTSTACAVAAGALATVRRVFPSRTQSREGTSPEDLRRALRDTAVAENNANCRECYGAGTLALNGVDRHLRRLQRVREP